MPNWIKMIINWKLCKLMYRNNWTKNIWTDQSMHSKIFNLGDPYHASKIHRNNEKNNNNNNDNNTYGNNRNNNNHDNNNNNNDSMIIT